MEPADVEPARFGEPPPTEEDPVYARPLDRATETGLPPEIVEAAAEACMVQRNCGFPETSSGHRIMIIPVAKNR